MEGRRGALGQEQGEPGREQLNWFEAELREHRPTFVFVHYPMTIVASTERADYGLHPLIRKYRGTIQLVVSGHWHKWFEFGRSFGPPHRVIAATRYDPNAYLIVDVDTQAASHTLANIGWWIGMRASVSRFIREFHDPHCRCECYTKGAFALKSRRME